MMRRYTLTIDIADGVLESFSLEDEPNEAPTEILKREVTALLEWEHAGQVGESTCSVQRVPR